jgi:hypothetical protein
MLRKGEGLFGELLLSDEGSFHFVGKLVACILSKDEIA